MKGPPRRRGKPPAGATRQPEPTNRELPNREPVEVVVERVGARGDGTALWQGHRLFVPLTLAGERVVARFLEKRADGWVADPLTVLEASPDRIDPPCPHFGSCGGCAAQHMADGAYRAWKSGILAQALERVGLLADTDIRPMVVTPPGTRRRAVLTAARRGRRLWLGFNERASHRLVDLEVCPVLVPPLVALIPPLRTLLAGLLADGQQVDVALTLLEDGVDVVLDGLPEPDLAGREILSGFAADHGLARLSRRAKPGAPSEPLAHRSQGLVRFGDVTVSPAPGPFLQASREGEAALVAAVLEAVSTAGTVADLFAGSGTFTFPLAEWDAARKVHAVESDPVSYRTLDAGARQLPGRVSTAKRDLFGDPLAGAELSRFAAVVFDPPRAGAAAQAAALAASSVPTVVAVSCNPASFARDARTLADGGYRLDWVLPVDQFLWSPHLELVARFSRA